MTQERDVQGKKIPWGKIENWVSEKETIVWYGKPSLVPMLPSLLFYFLISGGLLVITALNFGRDFTVKQIDLTLKLYYFTVPIAVLFLIPPLYALLRRYYTYYVLTDERVYKKRGIISIDPTYVNVDSLGEVDTSQNWRERIISFLPFTRGFADFNFSSYGTGGVDLRWDNVVNPWDVSDYFKQVESSEKKGMGLVEEIRGGKKHQDKQGTQEDESNDGDQMSGGSKPTDESSSDSES